MQRRNDAAERRHRVAELYLQGVPQHRIAAALRIAPSTVSKDLAVIRAEWLKSATRSFDEARSNELAKIDRMEAQCWESFLLSQEPEPDEPDQHTDGRPWKKPGDPRWLTQANACVVLRCKLLGLDQTTPAGTSVGVTVLNQVDLRVATGEVRHPEERMAMEEGQPGALPGPEGEQEGGGG